MLKIATLLVLSLVLLIRTSEALSCFPCFKIDCGAAPECSYGTGSDVCGCCSQCLKGPGEECGGPWGVLGDCAENYTCQLENEFDFNAHGSCEPATEQNEIRKKRGLAGTRRAGLSRVQARKHTHRVNAGIPEHIKAMLRARGVNI